MTNTNVAINHMFYNAIMESQKNVTGVCLMLTPNMLKEPIEIYLPMLDEKGLLISEHKHIKVIKFNATLIKKSFFTKERIEFIASVGFLDFTLNASNTIDFKPTSKSEKVSRDNFITAVNLAINTWTRIGSNMNNQTRDLIKEISSSPINMKRAAQNIV